MTKTEGGKRDADFHQSKSMGGLSSDNILTKIEENRAKSVKSDIGKLIEHFYYKIFSKK